LLFADPSAWYSAPSTMLRAGLRESLLGTWFFCFTHDCIHI
jgi:hypothetical protein